MTNGKDETRDQQQPHFNEQDRTRERDDVAEPNAPTAEEENEGMSTILNSDPADGVQENASEE